MTATLRVEPVEWLDPRAVSLREAMNAETAAMYAKFTAAQTPESVAAIDDALSIEADEIVDTIIALDGQRAVGHAALRLAPGFGSEVFEVKKVFVAASHRGAGVSRVLMEQIETLARRRVGESLVLQTGELQVPAIRLYERLGYARIPVYGKYTVMDNPLCYLKVL